VMCITKKCQRQPAPRAGLIQVVARQAVAWFNDRLG
jgi:hypothetical protein